VSQKHAVLIDDGKGDKPKRYTPEFQTSDEFARSWKSVLEKSHHRNGPNITVTCCCRGAGKKSLSVRHISGSDSYYLARFPSSGPDHDPLCEYFGLDDKSTGLKGYESGVIRDTKDGMLAIKLDIGLTEKDPPVQSDCPPPPAIQRPANGQSTMSLLGLLSLLWSEARLNFWYPGMAGKRDFSLVRYRLNDASTHIRSGRTAISDRLFIGTDPNSKAAEQQNARLSAPDGQDKRLLLLSLLPRYDEAKHEAELKFLPYRYFGGLPLTFFSSTGQWQSVKKRFPAEYAAWRKGGKVVVFVVTSPPTQTKRGVSVRAQQIALMMVSDNWIPLDSSYEATVASKLDAEQRSYVKPLRYDASLSEVFPDFCLLDTRAKDPFPMEVFGMTSPAYLARKALKTDYYNRNFGPYGWWFWDATVAGPDDELPPFPARK